MGCDIHLLYQKQINGHWQSVRVKNNPTAVYSDGPLEGRNYTIFAFLAGVRNYDAIKPIAEPRGLPSDLNDETFAQECEDYGHTPSWLSIDELLKYDYEQETENRRVARQIAPNITHGGCTRGPGEGVIQPLAEYLGLWFFVDLLCLHRAGVERIVFCFDN